MGAPRRFRDLHEAGEQLSPAELRFERARRSLGLFLGPAAFGLMLLLGPGQGAPSMLGAVLVWTIIWWVTEAVPIPVTALLAPTLAVLLQVGKVDELFAPFADPIIFLFMGSFMIAEAMCVSGLDRRFAFTILAWRRVGSSTTRILAAFAVATALASMWLSNTATAAMMCPVALSVLTALAGLLGEEGRATADPTRLRYGTALMLAIAYSASLGGIGTPVGTPPNLIAMGQLQKLLGIRISFFQWMLVCVPISLAFTALLIIYLRKALPPEAATVPGGAERAAAEKAGLGPWTRAQRNTLAAFAVTVSLWVLPGVVGLVVGADAPAAKTLQRLFPESVVALLGAILLFLLPVSWRERRFTLGWNDAVRIDWGTLLLFGGGLSMGGAMFRTGLARAIGEWMVRLTGVSSLWGICYLFGAVGTVLTETTSNTAAATMVCPLAIAAAQAARVSPVPPAIATALGCSMAFLLPVSTPPNAVVYGSGCVKITAMVRHGGVLDLFTMSVQPALVVLLSRLAGLG